MAELLQPTELPVNGILTLPDNPSELALTSKRQRRPSVRLGEIGDQPAHDSYRRNKQWNDTRYRFYPHKETGTSAKPSSRTRPLTNLSNGNGHETLDNNLNLKGKRGGVTKRVRSNWVSPKLDEVYDKFSGDEWYRDFDADRSESPVKEHSPTHSVENTTTGDLRRPVRARVSESRDQGAVELDGRSDSDVREWRCGASVEKGGCRSLEDGVRMWLNGLGLGRYEPVFEINEVDEEVLPLLTLEDLKDMGINAVGSRRKLYTAIQKLGRGFS